MKRLKLFGITLLAMVALAILAFGPRTREVIPQGSVVVDYWEKWSGAEERQMREIVDAFNQNEGAQKHIYVNYISTSNIGQKMLVACAAGIPPDIAGIWSRSLMQLAEVDALEPLEDMAKQHQITEKTYKKACWEACNFKGHLYAMVSTPASVALLYNKKMFKENAAQLRAAGLDPDRAPRTLDELDAYAKVLTKFDEQGRILIAGYLPMEPGWYTDQMPLWFGGDIWNPETKKFRLTEEHVIKAYTWIQSYSINYGKQATADFRSGVGNYDSPQNSFLAGKIAMEMQGPWMANIIYNGKPGMSTVRWPREVELQKPLSERLENYEWAAAPFPAAVPGLEDVTYCNLDVFVVPRAAKHKAEAMEFLAYVNRQDVMEKLCMSHCKDSPLAIVSENFINHHPNPYIGVHEKLLSSPNASNDPQLPIFPEISAEMSNITQRLVLLQTTPAEALAEAQVRLQAKYEAFVQLQQARHR